MKQGSNCTETLGTSYQALIHKLSKERVG